MQIMATASYEAIELFLNDRIENSASPRMYREIQLKLKHFKRRNKELKQRIAKYETDRTKTNDKN